MKISTWTFLWTVGALFTQTLWGQSRMLTDEEAQRIEIEAIQAMRSQDERHLAAGRLKEDCVTVSDPADRLLYQHEDTVNRFLAVSSKLGLSRMLVTHLSNPRLASHGGVARDFYGDAGSRWSLNGREYALTRPWGLIGSLEEPKAQAWLFRRSPLLKRRAKDDTSPLPKPEAYPLNRFEEHALSLLRGGEKLVRWENEQVMFAMGAVRADASCVRCHDGAEGDLLGAFTYAFAKTAAPAPDEKIKQLVKWHREGQKLDQMAVSLRPLLGPEYAKLEARYIQPSVEQGLLSQGIVTAEMIAQQVADRERVLKTDLGPVKKPRAAGAE